METSSVKMEDYAKGLLGKFPAVLLLPLAQADTVIGKF